MPSSAVVAAAFRPPRSLQPETTPGRLRRGDGWNGARGVARWPAAGSRQAPQIHAHSWVETWPTQASAASDPDGSCRRRANPHHRQAHQLMSVMPAPAAPKGAAAALPDASTAAGDGRWPPKAALLIVLPDDRQIRPAETRTAFASTHAAASPGVSGATPRTRPSRLPHPATNQFCRPPSDRRHRGWRQLNGCRHDRLSSGYQDASPPHHPQADGQFPATDPSADRADHQTAAANGAGRAHDGTPYPRRYRRRRASQRSRRQPINAIERPHTSSTSRN